MSSTVDSSVHRVRTSLRESIAASTMLLSLVSIVLRTPQHFYDCIMTTAHRPTWKPAVGRSDGGGWTAGGAASGRMATLDLDAHTKLKLRKGAQVVDKKAALRESLFKLEEAETKAPKIGRRKVNPAIEEEGRMKLLKQTAEVDEEL